jgi:hypothetical protein
MKWKTGTVKPEGLKAPSAFRAYVQFDLAGAVWLTRALIFHFDYIRIDSAFAATSAYATLASRVVKAAQLPKTAWQSVLEAMGMPADRTGLYNEMVKSFDSGWIHFGNPGTEKFHGPTTIEPFAQDLLKKRT